jgi:hypothetical protein
VRLVSARACATGCKNGVYKSGQISTGFSESREGGQGCRRYCCEWTGVWAYRQTVEGHRRGNRGVWGWGGGWRDYATWYSIHK